jgi:ribosome production factor 2
MGDKFGRVHVGRQDLTKLQTRKMKGLKRTAPSDDNASTKRAKPQEEEEQ